MKTLYFGVNGIEVCPDFAATVHRITLRFGNDVKVADIKAVPSHTKGIVCVVLNIRVDSNNSNNLLVVNEKSDTTIELVVHENEWKEIIKSVVLNHLTTTIIGDGFWE